MAESTQPAIAVPSDKQFDQQLAVGRALHNASLRARAALAIFEEGDFYDMAAANSDGAYALLLAVELLLKDVMAQAQEGMDANDALMAAAREVEVAHG